MKPPRPPRRPAKPGQPRTSSDWRPRIIRQAYDISPAVGDRIRRAVTRKPTRTGGPR